MKFSVFAIIAGATGLEALGLGCGSNLPPPNDQWAAAQKQVGEAQASGAPDVPEARLHLQLALEDLQKSKELMDHDNERATSLCSLANAEADLALSLAKESKAQSTVHNAKVGPSDR